MKHWLGKIQVTKVSWTISHVASTGGASGVPVNTALSGVHQPS